MGVPNGFLLFPAAWGMGGWAIGLGAMSGCGAGPGAGTVGVGELCVGVGTARGVLWRSPVLLPGQGGLKTFLMACPPHVLRELVTALRVPKLCV